MDPWGRKMSKSLGNGIDADSVLECGAGGRTGSWKVRGPDGSVSLKANKIGSECFRLWKACEAQVGDDFHINPEEIESKYFGVLTKIFNVARFASQFECPDQEPSTHYPIEDQWIQSEFASMMMNVEDAWTQLDIYTATQALKTFGTGVLPSHWLEMAKSRLYDGDEHAAWTIHQILRKFLAAFSPICPFFCHHISMTLYGQSSVDIDAFPELPPIDDELNAKTSDIEAFNSEVWKTKKENGLSLNAEIEGIEIPESLEDFRYTLTRMHKLL
jgi:valyl-tRNA synthetase